MKLNLKKVVYNIGITLAFAAAFSMSMQSQFAYAADPGAAAGGGAADAAGGAEAGGDKIEGEDSKACHDAKVFSGKMVTGVCWRCIFPIVILIVPIGGRKSTIPTGAAKRPICYCGEGMWRMYGIQISFWEPYRLVETVRQGGCSQVLLGKRFPLKKMKQGAGARDKPAESRLNNKHVFKHYHYYSYPLIWIFQLFMPRNCNPGGYSDIDMIQLSEIDPTWDDDELAYFLNIEAALIASPLGVIACVADVVASNIGKPIRALSWCAGSWGVMFPATGNTQYPDDDMGMTSLFNARILYKHHKRGWELRSMGKDAMCGGIPDPWLPKQQYRFSVFHPVAETRTNHVMGQVSLIWALGRMIPAVGEDPVILQWRWIDCCSTP